MSKFCPKSGLRKFSAKTLAIEMLESKLPLIGVRELKYGVTADPLFTGHVTQPNFGPKIGLKRRALTMGMLGSKLPLIVIVAP